MVQPSIRYPQPADAAPLRRPYLEALLWFVTLPSGVLIALYATRYFLRPVHNEHFARYLLPLRFHVAGGIGALLAGPWQFSETLRRRELNLHRLLGRC